jgi:dolichol-phosphate mannosyltransferase
MPTLNEAENIAALIHEVEQALNGHAYEIIVSDDDSGDRTWERAEEIARENPRVRVLRRRKNPGLGWSVIDGFSAARGEIVACMDADLQHDPTILPRMLQELQQGSDLVVASRYVAGGSTGGWQFLRKAESWLAVELARWFTGIRICDSMSGFFLLRRNRFLEVRERLDGRGFKILLELAANIPDAHISEVPYTFRRRIAGRSKISRGIIFAYISQLSRLRRRK